MNAISDLAAIIKLARAGDDRAFERLVNRFQDMAVGFGYTILHDVGLAEDAAQEAFFEAYRTLENLREPEAFSGWFRRIVFKQCDRLTRGKQLKTVPLELSDNRLSSEPDQLSTLEQMQMKDRIWYAIETLPTHEKETLVLYYIAGYSTGEVATFLDATASAVKKRLHSARNRLRDLLMDQVEDSLRSQRPSRSDAFASQTMELLRAARAGDSNRVRSLLDQNPRLLAARDPFGNTALVVAANSGHNQLAEMLLDGGVKPGLFEGAAIGRTDLVRQALTERPHLVNEFSPEGFTALALAAHFGHSDTVGFLLNSGAEVNLVARHPIQVTALHAALFGAALLKTGLAAASLLIEKGADVNARRGGKGLSRSGWSPLHYCAGYGFSELIEKLVRSGSKLECRDDEGKTPLRVALEAGQHRAAEILRNLGATE